MPLFATVGPKCSARHANKSGIETGLARNVNPPLFTPRWASVCDTVAVRKTMGTARNDGSA